VRAVSNRTAVPVVGRLGARQAVRVIATALFHKMASRSVRAVTAASRSRDFAVTSARRTRVDLLTARVTP
jgi:hypothetical protein